MSQTTKQDGMRCDSTGNASDKDMSNVDLDASPNSINDDDDDVSDASTIYDPSVLELDPKYKTVSIRYEETRQSIRGGIRFPGQDDEVMESPVARKGNGFLSNSPPEFDELPVFCCGAIPLEIVIIIVNTVTILVGVASLALGVYEVRHGQPFSTYITSGNVLLTSGPRIAALCCVCFGVALVGIGILGIFTAKDTSEGKVRGTRKAVFLIFQVLAILIMLIFILLAGVSISALKMWRGGNVLSQADWQQNMPTNPEQYCRSERQLKCAGFAIGQCATSMNKVAYQNCPGQFCADFCHVVRSTPNQSVNTATTCSSCRLSAQNGYDFEACKLLEVELGKTSPCGITLNTQLHDSYIALLILSIFASAWLLVVMSLASHRICCVPPVSRHGVA
jgi:hypothetical protein